MLFPLNDPNEYLIWLKHFHMNLSRLLPQSDVNGPSREGAPLWAPPACLSCSLNPEGPSQPPSSVEGALFSWSFHWSLVSIGFPTYLPPPSPRWPRGVCVCVCENCWSQLPKCRGLLCQAWKVHKHSETIDQKCTDEPCEGGRKLQTLLFMETAWKLRWASVLGTFVLYEMQIYLEKLLCVKDTQIPVHSCF